jgi:hypothetical protein
MLARRVVTVSALRLPRAVCVRFYAEHGGSVARDPGWKYAAPLVFGTQC